MELWEQRVTERKKAPTFASMYGQRRSNSVSTFCRITGKSRSMDEHHYVFSSDEYPKFDNLCGCRITEKHGHFKDYKYVYPILDLDGVTRMVTEHDFHCRITAKYKAMAGHKYVYPVLGARTDKTVDDMFSVVEEENMQDVILPSEVELIIRGGIRDVLKLKDGEHLFIQSKEGALFPAATKEIFKRKAAPVSQRPRRHTLPINLEAASFVSEINIAPAPEVKLVKDLRAPPPAPSPIPMEVEVPESTAFDAIPENLEVLKDVRKSRPKRPGRSKNKENEPASRKKPRRENDEQKRTEREIEETKQNDSDLGGAKAVLTSGTGVPKPEKEPSSRLSRLDRFKQQFQSFEENNGYRNTGSRLTFVAGFKEDEVEELDFSEPAEIQYIESQFPVEKHAVIENDASFEGNLTCVNGDVHYRESRGHLSDKAVNGFGCVLNGNIEEPSDIGDKSNESKGIVNGSIEGDSEERPKSFQEIKSLIGSKLNLEKALKLGKPLNIERGNNNVMVNYASESISESFCQDLIPHCTGEENESKFEKIGFKTESANSTGNHVDTLRVSVMKNGTMDRSKIDCMSETSQNGTIAEVAKSDPRNIKSDDSSTIMGTPLHTENVEDNTFENNSNANEEIRKNNSFDKHGLIRENEKVSSESIVQHSKNAHCINQKETSKYQNGANIDCESSLEKFETVFAGSKEDECIDDFADNLIAREDGTVRLDVSTVINENFISGEEMIEIGQVECRNFLRSNEITNSEANSNETESNSETIKNISLGAQKLTERDGPHETVDEGAYTSGYSIREGMISPLISDGSGWNNKHSVFNSTQKPEKYASEEIYFKANGFGSLDKLSCLEFNGSNDKDNSDARKEDKSNCEEEERVYSDSHSLSDHAQELLFSTKLDNGTGVTESSTSPLGTAGKETIDSSTFGISLTNKINLEKLLLTRSDNNNVALSAISDTATSKDVLATTNTTNNRVLAQTDKFNIGFSDISDVESSDGNLIRNDLRVSTVSKTDLPKPLESRYLSTSSECVLKDSEDLQSLEVRLPVTCRLLKREKQLIAECEESAICCSPPSGTRATMSLFGGETKKDAKWNNSCLQSFSASRHLE